MFQAGTLIDRLAGAVAQRLFQRGERTRHPSDGFERHETHGQQMRGAKAEVAHKRPMADLTNPDHDKSANDERDERAVDREDHVGPEDKEVRIQRLPEKSSNVRRGQSPGIYTINLAKVHAPLTLPSPRAGASEAGA
jgi:hypothetical protein